MTNVLTAHFATIVAQEALLQLKGNLGIAKRVNVAYKPEVATKGKIVQVPKFGALVANNKTAGGSRTVQDATSTSVSVTLNKHKEATFIIDDVEGAMSSNDLIAGYLNSAVIAVAEEVEADIFALYASAATAKGTSGTAVSGDLIRADVRPLLTTAKAPIADRSLFLSGEDYANLLDANASTGFLRADVLGPVGATGLADGALGKLYGFQVFESSYVPVVSGTNHNLAFHKDAIALVIRDLPPVPAGMGAVSSIVTDAESGLSLRVRMNYDSSIGGVATTVEILYGVAVIRPDFLVDVVS